MCIIDTNVVVAGLLTSDPSSPTAQLLDAMLDGRLAYLLSSDLLHEYRTVLLRPRLRSAHGLGPEQIDDLLTEIVANAIWRDPAALAGSEAAPDPGDQHLWALLAHEPAALLVSGDRLLQQKPKTGSSVVSPATALLGLGLAGDA